MPKLCLLADAISTHTQRWARYFADRGYEVHLISFRGNKISGVIIHHLKQTIPIKTSSTASIFSKIGYLFYPPKIKNLIFKISPDILHAHWATSYGLMGAYSKFHPFILSVWGRDIYKAAQGSFIYQKLVSYSLNNADYITATSSALANETKRLVHKDEKKILQIPFGVDVKQFSPTQRINNGTNITIGVIKKLEHYYGIEYLIRAFALLNRKINNIRLLIVGNGSQKNFLRQLAQELAISDNILFCPEVPFDKLPEYYRKIDIFVVPSLIESFGVVAVEASACGIPIVASDVGGLPEIVSNDKTGFLVPPKNPEAIACKLELLINKPDLRTKMGIAARQLVLKKYDWQQNALQMEKLYKQIIKQIKD